MLQIVLWALGTAGEPPALPASQAEPLTTDDVKRRLLELEERLDATGHVLMRDKVRQPRKEPP
ncbi:MAG: hypothetical protein ACREN5_04935 [Gemmatimonadales bacterium]